MPPWVFMDSPQEISRSYVTFDVDPEGYVSRSRPLPSSSRNAAHGESEDSPNPKTMRKRKRKEARVLNQREQNAMERHKIASAHILKAYSEFSKSEEYFALKADGTRLSDTASTKPDMTDCKSIDFISMEKTWQSKLCEIEFETDDENGTSVVPLFNNVIENNKSHETIASILPFSHKYLLPPHSKFLMSDVSNIQPILPKSIDDSYHLIVIDPPWENKSVKRTSMYPTIPNRQLLSFPIPQLAHSGGALLALWITNREKLHAFVEQELLSAWNATLVATWYWLKIDSHGNMIADLNDDNHHHRTYEVLLICCININDEWNEHLLKILPDNCVIVSVIGEHSRKPPIGKLLASYVPTSSPQKIELFAREIVAGWTCWGNEVLKFQNKELFHFKAGATNH